MKEKRNSAARLVSSLLVSSLLFTGCSRFSLDDLGGILSNTADERPEPVSPIGELADVAEEAEKQAEKSAQEKTAVPVTQAPTEAPVKETAPPEDTPAPEKQGMLCDLGSGITFYMPDKGKTINTGDQPAAEVRGFEGRDNGVTYIAFSVSMPFLMPKLVKSAAKGLLADYGLSLDNPTAIQIQSASGKNYSAEQYVTQKDGKYSMMNLVTVDNTMVLVGAIATQEKEAEMLEGLSALSIP